eukprot:GILI01008864.1.p1 GENE.GILI01008864.1~~GILI01008864.1.p1  ORF type:complete len:684 (+),score=144.95 GILI01008864.1:58-2109(+)
MPSFVTSPLDLTVALIVAADCQIIDVPVDASDMIRRNLSNRHRIVRIGTTPTPDRSSLRDVIANLPDDVDVEVFYELASEFQPRVDIANSVEVNGKVSGVSASRAAALRQLLEEEEAEASGGSPRPNSSGSSHASKGSKPSPQGDLSDDDGFSAPAKFTNPQMASFDTIDTHKLQVEDKCETIAQRLEKALITVKPGYCIIALCHEINPISEIELLAQASKKKVYAVDCALKVRNRPKPAQIAHAFTEAMHSGSWFAILHASKSVGTLQLLESLLKELHERNLEGVHPESKIFLCMEQHPHFPRYLAHGAVTIKFQTSFANSSLLSETLSNSGDCTRIITGVRNSSSKPLPPDARRKVRISAAVDIVDIEARELYKDNRPSAQPIDVSGSVVLQNTFSGLLNDKFLCVGKAGETGRFAVGSSLGNVYFLDTVGSSLLQVHAHDASIWDLSFCEKYSFATGSEDGTSAEWKVGSDNALQCVNSTRLGSDVYCVKYLHENDPSSPLITGGLASNLLVRSASGTMQTIRSQCSVQVIKTLPISPVCIVGGGDGTISLFDVNKGVELSVLTDHPRKVPTLSVKDENQFFSGSFDSTIRAFDCRIPTAHSTLTLKLKHYVTGLDVDENHLAASVGENLYLWDIRKLNEVLGGFPQAWKGLSRGVCVQSASNTVVTASPDGIVRFWRYV